MLELLVGVASTVFGEGARFALEQIFQRYVKFGPEPFAFDRNAHSYLGRRVYGVTVTITLTNDYAIRISEAVDGSGDGIVFFPATFRNYDPPIIGFYRVPDTALPRIGSISFEEVEATQSQFTLYFATERDSREAYIDLRYTILNERQKMTRSLLRVPLPDNT